MIILKCMPEDKKQKLDLDTIKAMKAQGMEKPPNVPHSNWEQKESLSHKHNYIAYLAAKGFGTTEISNETGMSISRISTLLQSERMKFEIRAIQYKLFGKEPSKRFKEILPDAIDLAERVMKDPNVKPSLKLTAAMNFMDRALGKPKQSIEVEGSVLRQLYDKMDGKKEDITVETVKDVEPLTENPNKAVEKKPNPNSDDMTQWVLNNFKGGE